MLILILSGSLHVHSAKAIGLIIMKPEELNMSAVKFSKGLDLWKATYDCGHNLRRQWWDKWWQNEYNNNNSDDNYLNKLKCFAIN